VSLNEVGGDPRRYGYSVNSFHHFNHERNKYWPHAMLSLSTHDSKRSADVRARINVLSEIPGTWQETVFKWSRMNRRLKRRFNSQFAPSRNDEYLFYQTLVGTWPLNEITDAQLAAYQRRICDYMIKAVREAKIVSSWSNPDENYEKATREFVTRALDPLGPFYKDCEHWIKNISYCGLYNALSQTLLQLASPGMPDLYQGEELWRYSLVDPDNRREVEFAKREELLRDIQQLMNSEGADRISFLKELWTHMPDGRIKLYLVYKTLAFRNLNAFLFSQGEYIKLDCQGEHADRVIAFARQYQGDTAIVIVPRFTVPLVSEETKLLLPDCWKNTCLILPESMPVKWREWFSDKVLEVQEEVQSQSNANGLFLSEGLACFPCALLWATH
jgi:(1->4)-alpha-D-glucan 1-alpha-D-glucosylmutase